MDVPLFYVVCFFLITTVLVMQQLTDIWYIQKLSKTTRTIVLISMLFVIIWVTSFCRPPGGMTPVDPTYEESLKSYVNYYLVLSIFLMFMSMATRNLIEFMTLPISIQLFILQVVAFIVAGTLYANEHVKNRIDALFDNAGDCLPLC
uniref:Chitin synthase export chaperone n=1 Tax=Panagrellus redivivus TaxID=6233 RepID=A0A7E4VCX4_PANRE